MKCWRYLSHLMYCRWQQKFADGDGDILSLSHASSHEVVAIVVERYDLYLPSNTAFVFLKTALFICHQAETITIWGKISMAGSLQNSLDFRAQTLDWRKTVQFHDPHEAHHQGSDNWSSFVSPNKNTNLAIAVDDKKTKADAENQKPKGRINVVDIKWIIDGQKGEGEKREFIYSGYQEQN